MPGKPLSFSLLGTKQGEILGKRNAGEYSCVYLVDHLARNNRFYESNSIQYVKKNCIMNLHFGVKDFV